MEILPPLATLVNFAKSSGKDVLTLDLYYGVDIQENGNTNYEWLVSIGVLEGYLRMINSSLKDSCEGLIEVLEKKEYDIIRAATSSILSNSNQIKLLLLQLQQLTHDKGGYVLSITYWPRIDPPWQGKISFGNHWQTDIFAQVEAHSLYEICTQLIEAFQLLSPTD